MINLSAHPRAADPCECGHFRAEHSAMWPHPSLNNDDCLEFILAEHTAAAPMEDGARAAVA